MRQDLLALGEDDLIALSNVGLVKRARRDLEAGEVSFELTEDAGANLRFSWSDGVKCTLKAGATLAQAECTCIARLPCRYVLRSVLAYQLKASEPAAQANETPPVARRWDPGQIPEADLEKIFARTTLGRARTRFEEGQVIELTRSFKPTAHFHTLAATVRFLVENNPGYVKCDCQEEVPCTHALMAIWAFRRLPADSSGGIVSTNPRPARLPQSLLTQIETRLGELLQHGISNLPSTLFDNLRRLEEDCRQAELIWPAEIIGELLEQIERYRRRDALFDPEEVARLVAELCARKDALQNSTGAVPELFIRGVRANEVTAVGSGRLIGLGALGQINRKRVELRAYLQDSDTGLVLAVRKEASRADSDPSRSASRLANGLIGKGISLAALSAGQLIVKGAKRTASYELALGRQAAAVNPQTFEWENLRAPTLVEDFSELRSYLSAQPPAPLRPRHLTQNFFVCPLKGAAEAGFRAATQQITATLYDREGQLARLSHPYTNWAGEGSEVLLQALSENPDKVCFIAGQVRLSNEGEGLTFTPAGLLFQQGRQRVLVQPWIDRPDPAGSDLKAQNLTPPGLNSAPIPLDEARHYMGQILTALGELYLLGLERVDRRLTMLWQQLARQGASYGFSRLLKPVEGLAQALADQDVQLNWQSGELATGLALELGVLALIALDSD